MMTLERGTPIHITELKDARLFRVMSLTGGDPVYLMLYDGEVYWLAEGICETTVKPRSQGGSEE